MDNDTAMDTNSATDTTRPTVALIPVRDVLTVDGRGAPEELPFADAIRTLFAVRAALGGHEDVPLEGSYRQDGRDARLPGFTAPGPVGFDLGRPDGWLWRLAVPAPAGCTAGAVSTAAARFGAPVHLRRPGAQLVVRLLHRGPYADEGPSLAALYAFAAGQGLVPVGPHTEVYLDDPGSTAPAALRTILQVPVDRAGVDEERT